MPASNAFDDIAATPAPPAANANAFDDITPPPPKPPPPLNFGQQVKRQLGLTGRYIMEGVGAAPLAVADAGVAVRNMLGGGNYKMPSAMYADTLDENFPKPSSALEKVVGVGSSGLAGAMGGGNVVPTIAKAAPSAFVSPSLTKNIPVADAVKAAQNAGYVVPPSTTNPTVWNKTLETIAGKNATAQGAALRNSGNTQDLAARALGLNSDAPLTPGAVQAVREEAGGAYDTLRNAGQAPVGPPRPITTGENYKQTLARILSKYTNAEQEFPGLARPDITNTVNAVNKDGFSSNAAVDAMSLLRDKADTAFRSGDSGAGRAFRETNKALEDAIQDDLAGRGQTGAVDAFKAARQQIAKSHSVEDAMNPGTGSVSATKLATALRRGAPLSGELKQIAEFGAAFPRAAAEPTHSMGVNHLDVVAPVLTAIEGEGLAQKLSGLGIPAARSVAKAYLLGPGQKGAIPKTAPGEPIPPWLLYSLMPGAQALKQ